MAAASLQILKSTLWTPVPVSRSYFPGKLDSPGKVALRFRSYKRSICCIGGNFRVSCSVQDGDSNQINGEEPPESLFMKELKRRGMTPTSLLEDTKRRDNGLDDEMKLREEDRSFSKRKAVSPELDKSLSNQRERSMALNSEGLEGLIPRAKLLLTIGGTYFLGFWPLILITVASFSALYLYFGSTFVHDASQTPSSPPPYVYPYALLEDERI
ncbi:uncharacterized protein LOC123227230 [Mangifera indica]|uniref:uncharacterized protein LOC123227230 n=1 Tax=Mangifera indica TaxID=29780 RepID=UPI001CFC4417|nr:uncharacterized protein LOC123227230 [Mangifera indica]